jgi:hypothetical protein
MRHHLITEEQDLGFQAGYADAYAEARKAAVHDFNIKRRKPKPVKQPPPCEDPEYCKAIGHCEKNGNCSGVF